MEWRKPHKDILKHRIVAIRWLSLLEGDEGEEMTENLGLFHYNSIYGYFTPRNGGCRIKYNDISYWYPLPDFYWK